MAIRKFKVPDTCIRCPGACILEVDDSNRTGSVHYTCQDCGFRMTTWTPHVADYLRHYAHYEVIEQKVKLIKGFKLKRKN